MRRSVFTSRRRAASAALAAVLLGFASAAPAEASGARDLDGAPVAHHRSLRFHHMRPWAGTGHARRYAQRRWRGPGTFVAGAPGPLIGAAGIPAGYASDESPYNVDAEDNEFDTGAFYGCLHNVLTAGGYRPVATCD